MPRNLNKDNDMDDDLKSDEFIVTQMQYLDLYKESVFSEDKKLLKLIKRSKSVLPVSPYQSDTISIQSK